ncbi:hypothetical protein IYX23_08965 [Methylocystis sp. L43]|jgi:hypothetical protein|uniref:hypothetical protein n=1 Tax=unclassified Methylocystis TaxID=2625913 RepID=UPI0018C331AC|nr:MULTISPECIES: hypothetical protein [unclassified Methylocystis]MBG0797800.1 hypothetical protein [Methylocystis sp. L43]MBG0806034.1 hypothetical protein [Methylocystis sp. H15]
MTHIILILACAGYAGAFLGWALAPGLFGFAWLTALSVWIAWPLGAMALTLIHALTGGRWGNAIHDVLAAGVRSVFLAPLLVIPYALTANRVYLWLRSGAAQFDNALYLNGPAFVLRGVIYLLIWLILAVLVMRANDDSDELARLAPAGLILLALTSTFAVIDAVMSLDPTFASSLFGLGFIAEIGALALSAATLALLSSSSPDPEALRQLARLLLAFVILWSYLALMQLIIVWQSDLPHEVAWYLPRWRQGWGVIAWLIVLTHFVAPFFTLLSARAQHSPKAVAFAAASTVFGGILHQFWLVAPAAGANSGEIALLTLSALLAMACTSVLASRLTKRVWTRIEA